MPAEPTPPADPTPPEDPSRSAGPAGSPRPANSAPDVHAAGDRPRFRLAFAPGVTPGKWARTWGKRMPHVPMELEPSDSGVGLAAVRSGQADAALVRLPFDRTGLHAIVLYTEATVAVMPEDHTLTLAEALSPADLADETVQHPLDDVLDWAGSGPPGIPAFERPATTKDALDLVAAGVGLTLMPQSLARLHHRKTLTYRRVEADGDGSGESSGAGGADAAGDSGAAGAVGNGGDDDAGDAGAAMARSQVALVWRDGTTGELMDEFIGIVRGRTPNSSRGTGGRGGADAAHPTGDKRGNGSGHRGGGSGGRAGSSRGRRGTPQKRGRGSAGKHGAPQKRGRPGRRRR